MRVLLLIVFSCLIHPLFPQIFSCKDGSTQFTSEAPLELIKAKNEKTTGVIDCKTKNVAFSVDIEDFAGFNSDKQREHFLENYMEVTKFPKANFKGKIIEDVDFSKKGVSTVRAKGMFIIHGVYREKVIKVKITVKESGIEIETTFDVLLDEHSIKVPKIVNQKIASVIVVDVKATLKPLK